MRREAVKYDLEDRLVAFACLILDVCDLLPGTRAGNNLEYQLSKSGTAPALIYGELSRLNQELIFFIK